MAGRVTEKPSRAQQMLENLVNKIAFIRAKPAEELNKEVLASGADSIILKSHEVVTCLVLLRPDTGIDPTKRDVLRDCGKQTLGELLRYVLSRMKAGRS